MTFRETLATVLATPTPEALWRLRADLLQAGLPDGARVWPVLDAFHAFLDELATRSSSREFSNLASKLDISAVGGVVLEDLLETDEGGEMALRLLSAVLSEGLMVLATRQHVRAWEGELAAVHRSAGWFLYQELWRWSALHRPDLPGPERRALIDRLFEPLLGDTLGEEPRTVLLGRLFQLLLVSDLSHALQGDRE